MVKVNFICVRHGQGCHNVANNFLRSNTIQQKPFAVDPELTQVGVDASIENGCHVSKVLRKQFNIDTINIVGCSPLIRCMETAYFMTRKWANPPSKIFVFPHLREIDENYETNKYSIASYERMERIPSYAMKTLQEQKTYLQSKGILKYFDFTFVERFPKERKLPGDLASFMAWFSKDFIPFLKYRRDLNVFLTTHHGVLRDATGESFVNNNGVVVETYDSTNIAKISSLTSYLPKHFFSNYKGVSKKDFYCPSSRCKQLCDLATNPAGNNKAQTAHIPKCNVKI